MGLREKTASPHYCLKLVGMHQLEFVCLHVMPSICHIHCYYNIWMTLKTFSMSTELYRLTITLIWYCLVPSY